MSPDSALRSPFRLGISALPYHTGYAERPDGDSGIVEALSEVVSDWLARSPSHEVVLLPFNNKPGPDHDRHILGPLLQRHTVTGRVRLADYSPDPSHTLNEIAACGALVAMRYHSVLLAHLAGTPMIVINYHGKTTALLDEIGFPTAARIPARAVAPGSLRPLVAALAARPDAHLAAKSPEMFHGLLRQVWPPDLRFGR